MISTINLTMAGGPAFAGWFACIISSEGAPSLRCLQGWVRRTYEPAGTSQGLRYPPFAKHAKDGPPTLLVVPARSIASRAGHPPTSASLLRLQARSAPLHDVAS